MHTDLPQPRPENSPAGEIVEHLFRHQAGAMTAFLCRKLGPGNFSLAEDAVQDALVQALRLWPFQGIPPDPAGWLFQTARNRALDLLRRKKRKIAGEPSWKSFVDWQPADLDRSAGDDQLCMIFACCHPRIAEESQIALTLKAVCGFGSREIARAFLISEETAAQRIVRAKREFKDNDLELAFPAAAELPQRLDAVLRVLYLLFNEGYCTLEGDQLIRAELCDEAIRLTGFLLNNPAAARPEVHALQALFLFQRARFATRVDALGELCLLPNQDRAQWDGAQIAEGTRQLEAALSGETETAYHLEAAIAACHVTAPAYAQTPWPELAALYERLYAQTQSPVVALNRAVVLAKWQGPAAGLAALQPLLADRRLAEYHLLFATLAELEAERGDHAQAVKYARQALSKTRNPVERKLLQQRVERYARHRQ